MILEKKELSRNWLFDYSLLTLQYMENYICAFSLVRIYTLLTSKIVRKTFCEKINLARPNQTIALSVDAQMRHKINI
jgi:hypothetical protein